MEGHPGAHRHSERIEVVKRPSRVVVASKNADKIREIESVLADLDHPIEVVRGLEWDDVEETEDTLAGNALLKARAVVEATGVAAIADDTGLEVTALGGAPGVHTARYAGEHATYAENVAKMLRELQGVPDRRARFRTAIALVTPEGDEIVVHGELVGSIATEARGEGGFGYDPIFEVESRTLAEIGAGAKNEMSHRGRAIRALAERLRRPEMGEPYDTALDEAIAYIDSRSDRALAIGLSGSLSRGDGDPNSDLDIYIIIEGDHRQRQSRVFNGVACEMFFNPARRVPGYFSTEAESGKAPTLGLVGDAVILRDTDGVFAGLREKAKAVRDAGPKVPAEVVTLRKYLTTDLLDNARDVESRDPATALALCGAAIQESMYLWFVDRRRWVPGDKKMLGAIRMADQPTAEAVDAWGAAPTVQGAAAAVKALIGYDTYFEWDSPREPVD